MRFHRYLVAGSCRPLILISAILATVLPPLANAEEVEPIATVVPADPVTDLAADAALAAGEIEPSANELRPLAPDEIPQLSSPLNPDATPAPVPTRSPVGVPPKSLFLLPPPQTASRLDTETDGDEAVIAVQHKGTLAARRGKQPQSQSNRPQSNRRQAGQRSSAPPASAAERDGHPQVMTSAEPTAATATPRTSSRRVATQAPAQRNARVRVATKPAPVTRAPAKGLTKTGPETDDDIPAAKPEPAIAESAPHTDGAPENAETADDDGPEVAETADSDVARAADFAGVKAGVTTQDELIAAWGEPLKTANEDGHPLWTYAVGAYSNVQVRLQKAKVATIIIPMPDGAVPQDLAASLGSDEWQSVMLRDDAGKETGLAVPERGVLFQLKAANSRQISQVVLTPLSAEHFLLRARQNMGRDYTRCLQDLDLAVKTAPELGVAHFWRARALQDAGRCEDALSACETALKLDDQLDYRLLRATILMELGLQDAALKDIDWVHRSAQRRPELRARALCLWGDLHATSKVPDFRKAIEMHMQAIRLAEPLAASENPELQRSAVETLIDAHLGAAGDIAWGNWKSKPPVVNKWLTGASDLARVGVEQGVLESDIRLRVSRRALAAYAGLQDELDPSAQAAETLAIGRELIDAANDELRKHRLEWELGLALYDVLQIHHLRGEVKPALEYGVLAASYLEQGSAARQLSPMDDYLLGRLYFRLGSIYAVHQQQHEPAVEWFDKAAPRLEKAAQESPLADAARTGETLVSMGVSYWSAEREEDALRVTQRGAELMEQAVAAKQLDAAALAVPYANLATMLEHRGETAQANQFQEMAAQQESTKRR